MNLRLGVTTHGRRVPVFSFKLISAARSNLRDLYHGRTVPFQKRFRNYNCMVSKITTEAGGIPLSAISSDGTNGLY